MGEPPHDGQDPQPGQLRTYLGTAPGVGKTYAMLNEGRRRSESGERVVVGWIERHGRADTRTQLRELEIVPPRAVEYRGTTFEELDTAAIADAVLALHRIPQRHPVITERPRGRKHGGFGCNNGQRR